jgi:hypothetical protein
MMWHIHDESFLQMSIESKILSLSHAHPVLPKSIVKASLNNTLLSVTNMFDKVTVVIILFFLVSSFFGHKLLHRVIKTPAQYTNPGVANVQ